MINPKTAMFDFYISIHQRLYSVKTVTSLSVFVGAFPGLFRLCYWVAATGDFGIEAGTLFLIQFFGNSLILGNWLVLV
jgi:protoheme IX farnesyltransferase